MSQIQLSENGTTSFNLAYNYALPGGSTPPGCPIAATGSGNNGDVISYTFTDTNSGHNHTGLYVYDSVNRLACAQATGNSTYNLAYSYTQDGSTGQYGNMTCVINGNTVGLCPQYSFNAANNHISGYTYDAAGNFTSGGGHTYQYDGEGRLASVDGGTTESTTYNALGQEVRINAPSSSYIWDHLYDPAAAWIGRLFNGGWSVNGLIYLGGRMLAMYSSQTEFIHVDELGTTTMTTSYGGQVDGDIGHYPWGQVWYNSPGSPEWHFAAFQYEETAGFDVTPNRKYTNGVGRWLTPDPGGVNVVNLSNPQTWNMYAYVRNNPTTDTDPTGLACVFGITIFGSHFGGTCAGDDPPPPPPPPPPAPAVVTPGTPQNTLANAQASARSNPAYRPQRDPNTGETKTFCNLATCDTVESVGGPTGAIEDKNGNPNLANTAAQQLPNSSQWHEVSPQEAQNLANQGVPVVAVQSNPGRHGHEVTVAPELMPGMAMQLYGTPSVNNVGARVGVMSAGQAFPDASRPVHYYAPNNNTPSQ